MVDHAEYIIGVFDNQKKLRSGTAQTVNYALHKGKVITLIHPDTMETVSYTHLDVYKRQDDPQGNPWYRPSRKSYPYRQCPRPDAPASGGGKGPVG